jgi:hypothetical protein
LLKPTHNHTGEEQVMATNKPVGDNARKGAVKKRSQLATKTMGEKDVHEAQQGGRSIHGAEEKDQVQRRAQREIAFTAESPPAASIPAMLAGELATAQKEIAAEQSTRTDFWLPGRVFFEHPTGSRRDWHGLNEVHLANRSILHRRGSPREANLASS